MLKVFDDGDAMFSTSDGVNLFYQRAGEGRTAVIFLHGWGGSTIYWRALLEHMDTAELSLVSMDLRGHGRSEHTLQGFTTERFSEDILDLAQHLRLEKLVLAGYSMSSRWVQWLCCTQPERVAGQILIAPVPALALRFPEGMEEDWIRQVQTREGFHAFESGFMTRPVDPELLDDAYEVIAATPAHSLKQTLRMCTERGFTGRLGGTRAATLVIAGEGDPMMTPASVRAEVVERIPGARMITLACGHNVPLEMPQETARILHTFLAEVAFADRA